MTDSGDVRYPLIRTEVINSLVELSGLAFQRSHWNGGSDQQKRQLADIIHRLFDDTALVDDPEACLDEFLKSKEELAAILNVIESLDVVLDKYGFDLNDVDYTYKPEWMNVVSSAQMAVRLLNLKM
jgi:hypothetical protein